MRYFRVESKITDKDFSARYKKVADNDTEADEMMDDIRSGTEEYNRDALQGESVFISAIRGSRVILGVATECGDDLNERIGKFLKAVRMPAEGAVITEILTGEFRFLVTRGGRKGFIDNAQDMISDSIDDPWLTGENLIEKNFDRLWNGKEEQYSGFANLREEIERIKAGDGKQHAGIPVHYIIRSACKDDRRTVYRLLLSALYNNGRLASRRYTFFNMEDVENEEQIRRVYASSRGCTVVARFPMDCGEAGYAMRNGVPLVDLCKIAKKYKNDVLSVICFSRDDTESVNAVSEELRNMCFVEIADSPMQGDRAAGYLKARAREHKIRSDKKLIEAVEEGKEYFANELDAAFDSWYDFKLRTKIYPQYKELNKGVEHAPDAGKAVSASEELEKMIGLSGVKNVINKAVGYYTARKIFEENGVKAGQPSMHMVFTGNPGTAKTTVARLFARIMREKRILSSGHLVEVGRGDLVGEYVGQTAPRVKEKFREAKGGVLFIDEAYSLVDDREGLYGDEAINTIVQEMENHRNDTIVIFAGYPDKMEKFLKKNPGLRSRIAFNVAFADYNAAELCSIAEMIAAGEGLCFGNGVKEKLYGIFTSVCGNEDFGNGRFVRNLIEQGKMSIAERLVAGDTSALKKSDVCTLTVNDIACPQVRSERKPVIGFCARTA